MSTPRVAIVGSGISGLAAAHALRGQAAVTLFEADARLGGHTHTVDVTLPVDGRPVTHGVDTGFLVFNERTYPGLISLLSSLQVPVAKSDMSFSVQVRGTDAASALEWSGSSLDTVFAQRANLVRPRFWRMLRDLLRFNALATGLASRDEEAALMEPLGDFLRRHGFGREFLDWYLLPMLGCIWSCPTGQMLRFPAATMIRFCHNHGLLQLSDRPQWWTVRGGAREYVARIAAGIADVRTATPVRRLERTAGGVRIATDAGGEPFDAAIVATHAGQALALLPDASDQERAVLGAIRCFPNKAVLHTDASVLPRRKAAWAAWNYDRGAPAEPEDAQQPGVCLHYLINRLQPLPWRQPVVVSLNPRRKIDRKHCMGEFDYAHPVFDLAALRAQSGLAALQGRGGVWFCGAWTGYGFHEDGLQSGQAAARGVLARLAPAGAAPRRALAEPAL